MIFEAIYYTNNKDVAVGYRSFKAVGVQDAKAVLKALLTADGITSYVLTSIQETLESFNARKSKLAQDVDGDKEIFDLSVKA